LMYAIPDIQQYFQSIIIWLRYRWVKLEGTMPKLR
jgi:hypothetical protein